MADTLEALLAKPAAGAYRDALRRIELAPDELTPRVAAALDRWPDALRVTPQRWLRAKKQQFPWKMVRVLRSKGTGSVAGLRGLQLSSLEHTYAQIDDDSAARILAMPGLASLKSLNF